MIKPAIVCGGRYYGLKLVRNVWVSDIAVINFFNSKLHELHLDRKFNKIIQGGGGHADKLARDWAGFNGIPCDQFDADWDRYGKAAGPIRNRLMLVESDPPPEMLIAFPGHEGTDNMIRQAHKMSVEVIIV